MSKYARSLDGQINDITNEGINVKVDFRERRHQLSVSVVVLGVSIRIGIDVGVGIGTGIGVGFDLDSDFGGSLFIRCHRWRSDFTIKSTSPRMAWLCNGETRMVTRHSNNN